MPRQMALASLYLVMTLSGAVAAQAANADLGSFQTSPPAAWASDILPQVRSGIDKPKAAPEPSKGTLQGATPARQADTEPTKPSASGKTGHRPEQAAVTITEAVGRSKRASQTDTQKETKPRDLPRRTGNAALADAGPARPEVSETDDNKRESAVAAAGETTTRGGPVSDTGALEGTGPEGSLGRVDKVALMTKQAKAGRQASRENPSSVGLGLSIIFKLGVVLALAYLTMLALKSVCAKTSALPRARPGLSIVDSVKLSQSSSLHLVEVNGRTLLIGSSSRQVNLLQEFDTDEPEESTSASSGGFAEYLGKYSGDSSQKTSVGRVAGMLRDCADHFKRRQARAVRRISTDAGGSDEG